MQNQIHKFYSFDFPKIKTDFILSVGSMCRVAHHLRRNRLRELACPLDWMINDKLEVVYDLFQSDFKDFFRSCSITKQDPFEVKDNHNDMLAIHYFFPNQDLEIQAKRVNGQAIRRWNTIKNIILSSKNVVFVRSGDFDLKTASKFLQKVAKLFNKNGGGGGITSSMLAIMKNCKRMK
ncbi:papain-like cysteine peptidase [Campylobacter helveticus]|uniref:papain-like cysteine peptidase n=1 Tax=Campylobacter helveticus TaxID=28898 RepID=UPI00214A742D|nr:papain-like cysteine peptidase [Campylobacter helveticus]MCR2054640.1 papain-like cysteine peptidase [Campylobacter helveticus]MCR2063316.1 papain-like cysteine peptidase [Campylobacter helveticus]MCR2065912.1 papain-like cysteine peptidase [Campylobacter helveticus]